MSVGSADESYSDIWGETIDLINKRQDEGEGDLNAKRPVGLCSKFTRGAIGVTINAPAAIAGPCDAAEAASFGPVFDQDGCDLGPGHRHRRGQPHRSVDD